MDKKTENKKLAPPQDSHLDAESIMLTLDQISQTIEVMHNVVGRLKRYVNDNAPTMTQAGAIESQTSPQHRYQYATKNRTLH